MATYPLKNISIGGDTYEIQAGNVGTAYYAITIVSYDAPDTWSHSGLSWSHIIRVNTDGTQQVLSFGDLYSEEELHSWNLPIFVYLQISGTGYGMWPCSVLGKTSGSYTIVADGIYNDTACYITITANTSTISSAYGETLSSGGGGGVALHTLSIYKNGSEISFTNLGQSDTVELWDISAPLTLDNTGLTNIIKTSPVVVKDDKFYGYISSWNTVSKELSLIYANSTQMYALTLSHQWNANWQVTSNKRLMTQ